VRNASADGAGGVVHIDTHNPLSLIGLREDDDSRDIIVRDLCIASLARKNFRGASQAQILPAARARNCVLRARAV
jgi:hypothetical protein